MLKLLCALFHLGLLTPSGLIRLFGEINKNGINLMLLFTTAGSRNRDRIALVDDRQTISYAALQQQCEQLACRLRERYKLEKGQNVALLCKNHASLVQSLFAVSRAGANVYLVNHSISQSQFNRLVAKQPFDLVIYDNEFSEKLDQSPFENNRIPSYHETAPSINSLTAERVAEWKLPRASSGNISLLTGGTTGTPKEIMHQPSIFRFLAPFNGLIGRLQLLNYRTAFVATPIFHGYGIAVLLAFMALGKKVVLQDRFDAAKACALIEKQQVEVITVVPLMIHQLLKTDVESLRSLACIASGGARLDTSVVSRVQNRLGNVLYNLYGTSETGLNLIATPNDLARHANTLGKKIAGGKLNVRRNGKKASAGEIGQFCMCNKWSMDSARKQWINTGDIGYRNKHGDYFLLGRADDLIVSAGNNIYPEQVEKVVTQHPGIQDAIVVGESDAHHGQVLTGFVQLHENAVLTEHALKIWLGSHLSPFEIPRTIKFVESLPYTAVGKPDRKKHSNYQLVKSWKCSSLEIQWKPFIGNYL